MKSPNDKEDAVGRSALSEGLYMDKQQLVSFINKDEDVRSAIRALIVGMVNESDMVISSPRITLAMECREQPQEKNQ